MADFEGLIRQALAKQDAQNEKVREKVYSSSRSALARMLDSRPGLTPQSIEQRKQLLETSISKIESEYILNSLQSGPEPSAGVETSASAGQDAPDPNMVIPARPPQQVPEVNSTGSQSVDPHMTPIIPGAMTDENEAAASATATPATSDRGQSDISTAREPLSDNAPEVSLSGESQDFEDAGLSEDYAAAYRARRNTIRWLSIIGLFAVLALIVWVAYVLITSLAGGITVDPVRESVNPVSPLNQVGGGDRDGQYITILEAADPSAIVTDGRGKASIVEEQSLAVLRLVSIRSGDDKTQPAEPMLLEIKPGILQQIAGKKVTVEVLARSGSSGPATFAIECDLGDYGSCGRKRFRVGLQPEAVVFSVDISQGNETNKAAYLAISTDIASSANLTGRGDVLDLISARVRVLENE